MAYAALISLSELLEHTLQLHHPHKYFYIPLGADRQKLESIHESSTFLQAFLDDHHSHKSSSLQSLEVKIRDAAYRAQDIIEWHISNHIEFIYEDGEVEKQQLGTHNDFYQADLLESLDFFHLIVEETVNIQISCSAVEELQINTNETPSLASSSQAGRRNTEMVGCEEDLVAIQERLCGESSKLKIIPIVGMGGIGKTTLARTLFDDSLIAYHFHTRAWAAISQEYRLQGILRAILHSLTLKTEELAGEIKRSDDLAERSDDSLRELVYHSLIGKRYLIVLDDVWSTDAWDDLRMIFPDNNNGSRIIITTRLGNVAEPASSSSPVHHMHLLNEDESWDLLREKVFAEESCPPELEEIGKIVSKNCGGLPLAIVVVAGILTKVAMTHHQWKNVADNLSAAVAAADHGNFSKILSLSYDHLPNHLKTCFLYIGSFSVDKEIPVSNLIKLWVAEGFLKPIESKTLEVAAEEYLKDLVERNLVFMTTKTWTGRYKFCGVHDLLRDLCIHKAEEEEFLSVIDTNVNLRINLTNSRRLAIYNGALDNVSKDLLVRSILQISSPWELSSLLSRARLVRVLAMPKAWLNSIPDEIVELFHLRYLAAFAHCNMGGQPLVLPPTVSNLQNLQTLIVERYADEKSRSPVLLDIWKLPLLRHIVLKGCMLQVPPPSRNCPVLEKLQTVSTLKNFILTRNATSMIPSVKELRLLYTTWSILGLKNVVHFHKLEALRLDLLTTGVAKIHDATDASKISVPFPVYYGLPNSLKRLSLVGCRPPSEDMSIIGSLPNLEVLKLKIFDFVDRCWETKEGEFARLRFLKIYWSNIINWQTESSHFPRLEHLIVRGCWVLEEIPIGIGDIGTLKVIEVDQCSKTAADSALSIQEDQQSMGNEELVVTILNESP